MTRGTGRKKGALFLDLDGTLADSGTGITTAVNQVLASLGTSPLTQEEARFIIGPAFQHTMPVLLRARGMDESLTDGLITEYRRVYTAEHLPRTPRIEGIGEVMDELAARYHLSVVTAKPVNQAVIAVRALRMEHMMEIVIGPQPDAPVPKARLLETAIAHVHATRDASLGHDVCWMIGDRHHDIDAAVEVGTNSIGVMWGYGDEEELSGAGATHIARAPSDLLAILG
ncbi:MAG: HAD family hydrolase [Actinomycetota bacterium]